MKQIIIKYKNYLLFACVLVLFAVACKKPYVLPVTTATNSFLVAEGTINTGNGNTVITLSRTVNISSTVSSAPVYDAQVSIEGSAGFSYTLTPQLNGQFMAPPLNLPSNQNYRIKIVTVSDGNTYVSDYVPPINTPPIDSVSYAVKSNGVQIYVNTHGASTDARYYQWTYGETWDYHAAFLSLYIFQSPDQVVPRQNNQYIYRCWRGDSSTNITLGSSAKLTQNIISQQPLTFINSTSEKFSDIYSILVTQTALTGEAYNYYSLLKKNTEQLGGIFDAQPSELTGNIHCVNSPSTIAIGYITAGNSVTKRIFIDNRNLPAWAADNAYAGCKMDTLLYKFKQSNGIVVDQVAQYIYSGSQVPLYPYVPPGGTVPIGIVAANYDCADCTLRGTNVKPAYWP